MGTATGMEEDIGATATVTHSTMAATTMEIDGTVAAIIIVAIIGKI
jgi:inorganic pyrophosphatase/exopolyphosphatase